MGVRPGRYGGCWHASSFSQSALPAGLVSWWQAEGSANDAQGGNNGMLQSDATFAPGKVGQAFSFDGNGGAVLIGNPANLRLSAGDFAVDAWVNFTSLVSPPGSPSGPWS